MSEKKYKMAEDTPPMTVSEPAVVYATSAPASTKWNPNVPFHGTQEEWFDHFHRIEQGNFTPLEEANREFELWKKEFLANRLR